MVVVKVMILMSITENQELSVQVEVVEEPAAQVDQEETVVLVLL